MPNNSFGDCFRITTWGESHGPAIGVVIDGCPSGLELSIEEIQKELDLRRPGQNQWVSERAETDQAQILSGVYKGKTTGSPISILIPNKDKRSEAYTPIENLLRPGHNSYSHGVKYGHIDPRGGGRSTGRETACRVAAAAVAKKLLSYFGISCHSYLIEAGGHRVDNSENYSEEETLSSSIFCPSPEIEQKILSALRAAKQDGDSIGGSVYTTIDLPITGLGDPIYQKLTSKLASAMMSIPASKAILFGSARSALEFKGSEFNDLFSLDQEGQVSCLSNHAGGTLGGVSSGMPITFEVIFKPTSSIAKPQKTLNHLSEEQELKLPEGSRHDPCLALRATRVVEAMSYLVIADALLKNPLSRIESLTSHYQSLKLNSI